MKKDTLGYAMFVSWSVCAIGCGGETGAEGGSRAACSEVVDTQAVGPDDPTPGGRAVELAATAAQLTSGELAWLDTNDGGKHSSVLNVRIEADVASAVRVRRATGASMVACSDALQMNASLSFATEDGVFNEEFTGFLFSADGHVRFDAKSALDTLRGTYRPTGFPPSLNALVVRLVLAGSSSNGVLSLEPDGTSWPDAGVMTPTPNAWIGDW